MDRDNYNVIIEYFVVSALQNVINLINARIDKHDKEARNICKHTDGITESDNLEVHELDVMAYEGKEIIKEIRNLKEMEVKKNG
tara:strand:- start:122 stop:373 length:252 start_codon:yes stop_codon:yes gene_type:complete